jgi:hypothetical protein
MDRIGINKDKRMKRMVKKIKQGWKGEPSTNKTARIHEWDEIL